jgi:hypothetical protein
MPKSKIVLGEQSSQAFDTLTVDFVREFQRTTINKLLNQTLIHVSYGNNYSWTIEVNPNIVDTNNDLPYICRVNMKDKTNIFEFPNAEQDYYNTFKRSSSCKYVYGECMSSFPLCQLFDETVLNIPILDKWFSFNVSPRIKPIVYQIFNNIMHISIQNAFYYKGDKPIIPLGTPIFNSDKSKIIACVGRQLLPGYYTINAKSDQVYCHSLNRQNKSLIVTNLDLSKKISPHLTVYGNSVFEQMSTDDYRKLEVNNTEDTDMSTIYRINFVQMKNGVTITATNSDESNARQICAIKLLNTNKCEYHVLWRFIKESSEEEEQSKSSNTDNISSTKEGKSDHQPKKTKWLFRFKKSQPKSIEENNAKL